MEYFTMPAPPAKSTVPAAEEYPNKCDNTASSPSDQAKKFPLLEKLLSFFGNELNPVLAGYVVKILVSLLDKKRAEVLSYLHANRSHLDNLISHSSNSSVSEALSKLLSAGDPAEAAAVQRREILHQVIQRPEDATLDGRWETAIGLVNARVELQYLIGPEMIRYIYTKTCESYGHMRAGLRLLRSLMRVSPLVSPPRQRGPFREPPSMRAEVSVASLDYTALLAGAAQNMPFFVKCLVLPENMSKRIGRGRERRKHWDNDTGNC